MKTKKITNLIILIIASVLIAVGFFIAEKGVLASATIFSDGFESGDFRLWTTADKNWRTSSTNAHSGKIKALVEDTRGDSNLQKNISTSGYENITLSYWYKIDKALKKSDHVYVEWSPDGKEWNELTDYTNTKFPSEWTEEVFNLSSKADNNPDFSFRFRANLKSGRDEFWLDDVSLSGAEIDSIPPGVSISGAPKDWTNLEQTAIVVCDDEKGSGCDEKSLKIKTYSLAPEICPTKYSDYDLENPQTISSHLWVCGAAKDLAGNEGFSEPAEFLVDKTAPVVDAGVDQTTHVLFTQDATASDADSGIANYVWSKVSGPGNITFGTPDAEDTTILADEGGEYVIQLTVTDNAGNSGSDTMRLIWDAAELTVVKVVINDNGGAKTAADFNLHVKSGDIDIQGSPAAGSESGITYIVKAGAYIVSEVSDSEYSLSISGDCDQDGSVTLNAGDKKTCAVTNDDIPPPNTGGGGGGGGGGGYIPPSPALIISNIFFPNIAADGLTIAWTTNFPSSSYIIYSAEGEPHSLDMLDNLGNPPKYGYARATDEINVSLRIIFHSVAITGLNPSTTYYFRTVSRGSLAISGEYKITTLAAEGAPSLEQRSGITGEEIAERIGVVASSETQPLSQSAESEEKSREIISETIAEPQTNLNPFIAGLGEAWRTVFEFSDSTLLLIIVIAIFVIFILVFSYFYKRFRRKV